MYSSPVIGVDGTIFVGSSNADLCAINPDGSEKWRYATGAGVYSSPAVGEDGTVYIGSYDDKIHAVHADGSAKWSYTVGGDIRSSPTIGSGGALYIGSDDRILYALSIRFGNPAESSWPMFHQNPGNTGSQPMP